MKVGEIFVWITDQAAGHERRRKFHVYIGEAGWRDDGHAFLFISSGDYGGDYCIRQDDYGFLTKAVSYVSTQSLVVYPDAMLTAGAPARVGQLRREHMGELREAVARSEIMERWQIRLVCEAIDRA